MCLDRRALFQNTWPFEGFSQPRSQGLSSSYKREWEDERPWKRGWDSVPFLRRAGTQAHRGILCYINKGTAHRGRWDKSSKIIFLLKSIHNYSQKPFFIGTLAPHCKQNIYRRVTKSCKGTIGCRKDIVFLIFRTVIFLMHSWQRRKPP